MNDDMERNSPTDGGRYRIDDRHPSVSIAEAIADVRGVSATNLTPISERLDPGAFDSLYVSLHEATGTASITFSYDEDHVAVSGDGAIAVRSGPIPEIDDDDRPLDETVLDDASRESVSLSIVQVISERAGEDPIEMGPPLADAADPQALDRLFQHDAFRGSVEFEYDAYRISVVAGDRVRIGVSG